MNHLASSHSEESVAAPVLKWAGGKRRLLSQYEEHFPCEFGSYYEPFVGGGAVFFWLQSKGALRDKKVYLNDINPELVNLYEVLVDHCQDLVDRLSLHAKKHCEEYYYSIRSKDHRKMKPITRAARLIYLNRTCFNGLYRVNNSGHFNVPMGRYKNPLICDEPKLWAASRSLRSVTLSQGSYRDAVSQAQKDDLVYFDPPYVPLNPTSSFTSYTKENFGLTDQKELADTFRELHRRGVKVLLSNSDTPTVRELFQGFTHHPILAPRAINSKADRRQKVSELLIES